MFSFGLALRYSMVLLLSNLSGFVESAVVDTVLAVLNVVMFNFQRSVQCLNAVFSQQPPEFPLTRVCKCQRLPALRPSRSLAGTKPPNASQLAKVDKPNCWQRQSGKSVLPTDRIAPLSVWFEENIALLVTLKAQGPLFANMLSWNNRILNHLL